MQELLYRLKENPLALMELIISSFFIGILGLTSSLYVIQVLNRFLGFGVNSTLITLTLGVVIAIGLEYGFRRIRLRLAEGVGADRNQKLMIAAFEVLIRARVSDVKKHHDILDRLECIESTYNTSNITLFLDIPFAFLFVLTVFLISPSLGLVTLTFIIGVLCIGLINQGSFSKRIADATEASLGGRLYFSSAGGKAADTIRLYGHQKSQSDSWRYISNSILHKKSSASFQVACTNALLQASQSLLNVSLYAVGAILVLQDELNVGSLIGVNLLANRAFGPISKISGLGASLIRAEESLRRLKEFGEAEMELVNGVSLRQYSGRIRFKNISYCYPKSSQSVFESLNFDLPAGETLLVTGAGGEGKSTIAQLIAGLIKPQQGAVLAEGIELGQFSPIWWRRQLLFLQQEPSFLNVSLYENIFGGSENSPSSDTISKVISMAGLDRFIDQSAKGLQTLIEDQGGSISLVNRKRLALARGLASGCALVVLDEPTGGLDIEGKNEMYQLVLDLSKLGKTQIILSQDPVFRYYSQNNLDLDVKPSPRFYRKP